MFRDFCYSLSLALIGSVSWGIVEETPAQIISDHSLPSPSSITIEGRTYLIDGGTAVGENLFHSFEQFSLSTSQAEHFNNALTIQNIFSRVTGQSASYVDGLIRANGSANLFLLNPNGIIFGPNAALDLGGSFFATTAKSIHFSDGGRYSATHPASSLLTVSSPMGLTFDNPGAIVVRGGGHGVQEIPILSPLFVPEHPGLKGAAPSTLGLLGGEVLLEGGILSTKNGQVEITAVEKGFVRLRPNALGWSADYHQVEKFKNITLDKLALVEASGTVEGAIRISGQNINVKGGGLVLTRNLGGTQVGNIEIEATGDINLSGDVFNPTSPLAIGRSSITTENLGEGKGGRITISANNLTVRDGAIIGSRNFGRAAGSEIELEITEDIEILDYSPINNGAFSGIVSVTGPQGRGKAGNINLWSQKLLLSGGGSIFSATSGPGSGGSLTIQVSDRINLTGFIPNLFFPSTISAGSNGSGNSGNLIIETSRLILDSGARIDTSSFASGDAGNLTIKASKSIELSGEVPGSINPTVIGSSVDRVDPILQELLQLPAVPIANSGNVTVHTPSLTVRDGALITVRNDGIGRAGNLTIEADSTSLVNRGQITASTTSGKGGNIRLQSTDLQLQGDSTISATAAGSGDGGNIEIAADTVLLVERSNITANARRGRGGNISITATLLLVSSDSRIAASSQLGLDGVVEIQTPENNLQPVLQPLRVELLVPETVLEGSCLSANYTEPQLLQTGGGNLPSSPDSSTISVPLSSVGEQEETLRVLIVDKVTEKLSWKPERPILPANKVIQLPDGRIVSVTELEVNPKQVRDLLCSQKVSNNWN